MPFAFWPTILKVTVPHHCLMLIFPNQLQEVCGLRWSHDNQLLASGGNDNKVFIWSSSSSQPVHKFSDHVAAVKALAWSPQYHNLLVSGGGTADKTIRFWNTTTGQQLHCIDTGSQVRRVCSFGHAVCRSVHVCTRANYIKIGLGNC